MYRQKSGKAGDHVRKQKLSLNKADRLFFQSFYENYKHFIYKTAMAYDSEPDDLVQETLLRLMRNIASLRELNHCKTMYYIVIAVRTAFVDLQRQQGKSNMLPLNSDAVIRSIYSGEPQGEEMTELYVRTATRQLREQMSERDWMILTGKILMGYTHEELAQMLDIKPENIRMVYSRAKAKARRLLSGQAWKEEE